MIDKINLLGPLEIESSGRPAEILKSTQGCALLSYLLVTRQRCSREFMAALLWDGPTTADTLRYLRKLLYRVGPLLPDLDVTRQQVAYRVGADVAVDLYALEAGLASQEMDQLERGLQQYRGDLLAGFYLEGADGFNEWLAVERERLRQDARDGFRRLCAMCEPRADWPRGVDVARRWLILDAYDEEVHRVLMRFLVADGQIMAAKQQFEYCRSLLWNEFGVEPEPATVDLYEQIQAADRQANDAAARPLVIGNLQHWGEAPSTERFFGRQAELDQLYQWINAEQARIISILGIGGQGKTSLAAQSARAQAGEFVGTYWRSLLNAPPVDMLLHDYLNFLWQNENAPPEGVPAKLAAIQGHLQRGRHLLVLDNLESVLDDARAGHFRSGYEDYEQVLQLFGNGGHQSTLILTSREAPLILGRLERSANGIKTLVLAGLSADAGAEMLATKQIAVDAATVTTLTQRYSGNPLALQLVAQTIEEFFFGNVDAFLAEETFMFEDIRDVLERQFARLSPLEQEIMYWLAITREATDPISLARLMLGQTPRLELLDAMKTLQRRSLIERERLGFSLQNVVTEYLTTRIIEQASEELVNGDLNWLHLHPLIMAQAREHIRQVQEQLLLHPVAEQVAARLGRDGFRLLVRRFTEQIRALSGALASGFAAGNLLNLLRALDVDVTGLDFSRLTIRQANLRGWTLPNVNFSGSTFSSSLFTANFSTPHTVDIHPAGHLLAVGTESGDIRLWTLADAQPERLLEGHTKRVSCVEFNPDGRLLAGSSLDDTVSLWDLSAGYALRRLPLPTGGGGVLAFSPDGRLLATGGKDGHVSLWDVATGRLLHQLETDVVWIYALAFSPQGNLLACGGRQEVFSVWDLSRLDPAPARGTPDRSSLAPIVNVPTAHAPVTTLAFTPDGAWLVSGGGGNVMEVWDVGSLHSGSDGAGDRPLHTFTGDTTWIYAVAVTADSKTLAGASGGGLIYLSDLASGRRLDVLTGHRQDIHSLAFDPVGTTLVSASTDDTLRIWRQSPDASWQISTILQSHTPAGKAVAFSPDGALLAVGDTMGFIHLWQGGFTSSDASRHQTLNGHTNSLQSIAFRPGGKLLASAGVDKTIRIWDLQPADGGSPRCVNVIAGHDKTLYVVAFSPDGSTLFCSSGDGAVRAWRIDDAGRTQPTHLFQRDTVAIVSFAVHPQGDHLLETKYSGAPHLWEIGSGDYIMQLSGLREVTWLAYSPRGDLAAAATSEGHIGLWDTTTAAQGRLVGVSPRCGSAIWQISYAAGGELIAGACEDGAIRLWDPQQLDIHRSLSGHSGTALAIAFSPDGKLLASGGSDGTVKLWDPATGVCVNTLTLPKPYAGMDIRGVTGITEAQRASLKALGAVEVLPQ